MLFILLLRQGRPQRTAKINTRQLKYIYIKIKRAPNVQLINMTAFLFYLDPVCAWSHISTSRRFITGDASRLKEEEQTRKKREGGRVCLALRGRILPQTHHHHRQLFNGILPHTCQPCTGVKISFSISFTRLYSSRPVWRQLWAVTSPLQIKKNTKHPDSFGVFEPRDFLLFLIQRCVGFFSV